MDTEARSSGAPGGAERQPGSAPSDDRATGPANDPSEILAIQKVAPELEWTLARGHLEVRLPADKLLQAAMVLRHELGYDYLSAVTGVDWKNRFEVLYHVYSYDYERRPGCVVLRVSLPREEAPSVDSVTSVWPGAEFQEREVYDLMGIRFVGHPDLRRILLDDNFPGHPLRKDFVLDPEYILVKHLRYGAEGQLREGQS